MKHILQTLAAPLLTPDEVGVPKVDGGSIIPGLLGTVYWAAGVTAIIVIIIGGILYVTSDGDSSKIKKAKDAILYAVVGLVVVMFAFVITNFVAGRF